MIVSADTNLVQNTSHKLVLPFYIYAGLALLAGCAMLVISPGAFTGHYFHPQLLAITHTMALGWGTMMILGAGHQLLPVLIEGKLYSARLAWLSFFFAATGIPLLVWSFYTFNLGLPAQLGGSLVNLAVVCFLINVACSVAQSKKENVHAVCMFTAVLWLLLTTAVGLLLLCNFTHNILPNDSLYYLSMHAHMGIAGWFLLMITGVGSRLIPMFLISKYNRPRLLWIMYACINGGLIAFILIRVYFNQPLLYVLPTLAIIAALVLFGNYCRRAWQQRIRRQVDGQMKISLLSVAMMALPLLILLVTVVLLLTAKENTTLVTLYGFAVFFGWITAIVFGMTFKTLPFIVWNKVYHLKAGLVKTPNPKELFSDRLFNAMSIVYLAGFILFSIGILFSYVVLLNIAAILLLLAALLYNANTFKIIFHKAHNHAGDHQ